MTFDREPDLDNANVGMPDTRHWERKKFYGSYQIGSFRFLFCFGGEKNGKGERRREGPCGQDACRVF